MRAYRKATSPSVGLIGLTGNLGVGVFSVLYIDGGERWALVGLLVCAFFALRAAIGDFENE